MSDRKRMLIAGAISIGSYLLYKKSKSFRIHLKHVQHWNITQIINFLIYSYKYHFPLLLDDLFILILLHGNYSIKLNSKTEQILMHYMFIFLCQYILSSLYKPNGCILFERMIEKPINNELNQQIAAINDLLDEQLSHVPYLKNEVWEFLGHPMDNIDVDELLQSKFYVENLKKLYIDTQKQNSFNFTKELLYKKYLNILKWIKTGFNTLYDDNELFDAGYDAIFENFTSFRNQTRVSWLMMWTMIRISIHFVPRMIGPFIFYSLGRKTPNILDKKSNFTRYCLIAIKREPAIFIVNALSQSINGKDFTLNIKNVLNALY